MSSGLVVGLAQSRQLNQTVYPLVFSALVFIVVFFWVESFYSYWNLFVNPDDIQMVTTTLGRNLGDARTRLSFTILLTILLILLYWYHPLTHKPMKKEEETVIFEELSSIPI